MQCLRLYTNLNAEIPLHFLTLPVKLVTIYSSFVFHHRQPTILRNRAASLMPWELPSAKFDRYFRGENTDDPEAAEKEREREEKRSCWQRKGNTISYLISRSRQAAAGERQAASVNARLRSLSTSKIGCIENQTRLMTESGIKNSGISLINSRKFNFYYKFVKLNTGIFNL